MQRKPGFPVANCGIKMPDNLQMPELSVCEDDSELQQRRQQLINFGHSQWGFNNWNWAVTKQDLDFVDLAIGKYTAGVVAFVSVSVKSLDIHRENIGYATSVANTKGFAIYKSRKVAVTNALRETLLSFGGTVASELMDLLETNREPTEPLQENNQNIANINTNTSLPNTKIAATNLLNTKIATTNLPNTNIGATNLSNTNIGATNLPNTNLATTNLSNTNIGATNLPNTNIGTTNLANTNLNSANHVSTANLAPTNHVKSENAPMIKNLRKESESVPINIPPQIPPMKNAAPVAKAHPMPANLTIPRAPAPTIPRPNSNEPKIEGLTEEEARAERKRRQRLAQEEFRQKQMLKGGLDDKHKDQDRNMNSFDQLLMEIPTQDIVIEETGASKRKSPTLDAGGGKRRASISKLDILHD